MLNYERKKEVGIEAAKAVTIRTECQTAFNRIIYASIKHILVLNKLKLYLKL